MAVAYRRCGAWARSIAFGPNGGLVRTIMKLIERYIFRRVLALSLTTLCATTAIVLTTQVLLRVNILTESGESLGTFLKLALFLVPAMAMLVMPFALLIGASQNLNAMNGDSELAVIEASGGSNLLIAKPVMLIAVAMTLISLASSLFVEPWSNRQLREIVSAASADLMSFAVQSGTFKRVSKNLYIQIDEQLPGGDFGGIFIVDLRNPQMQLIYYAKRGAIRTVDGNNFLVMQQGEIQRKNQETGQISTITFASYALDFATFDASQRTTTYYPKERSTTYLFSPDPNDPIVKSAPAQIRGEIHRRFSEWLYPLLFGLIAVYFGGAARSNRDERLWSLGLSVLIALAFRSVGFLVVGNSGQSLVSALLCYLVPLSGIVIFAVLVAFHKVPRIAQSWVDRTSDLIEHIRRLGSSVGLVSSPGEGGGERR
jgi:lipopolysaccharide export system permease protein